MPKQSLHEPHHLLLLRLLGNTRQKRRIKKNCQLFCTLYLTELGLPAGALREDTDKAVAVGLAVLAVVGIVYAYRMKSA